MIDLRLTSHAKAKYDLLNGVRSSLATFFDQITNEQVDTSQLNEVMDDPRIYSKRIATLYVLIHIKTDRIWYVVDILPEIEYNETFGNS